MLLTHEAAPTTKTSHPLTRPHHEKPWHEYLGATTCFLSAIVPLKGKSLRPGGPRRRAGGRSSPHYSA